jgi:arsenate reductase (glutaredoxin)
MADAPLDFYQYPNCSTCRAARKWLDTNRVAYRSIDITEHPPSVATLRKIMKLAGLELRKLFNTSGQSYRGGGWKDKLAQTSEADALAALAADGMLIKRPILVGDGVALVGFSPDAWAVLTDR